MIFLALKILIGILAVCLALGIACAIWLAFRRQPGIGASGFEHPRHVDPFSSAFGDVPYTGFTARQLGDIAPIDRPQRDHLNRTLDFRSPGALQRTAAGRRLAFPSGMPAGRKPFCAER